MFLPIGFSLDLPKLLQSCGQGPADGRSLYAPLLSDKKILSRNIYLFIYSENQSCNERGIDGERIFLYWFTHWIAELVETRTGRTQ